jgi:uncharacterized membrane protein
LGQPLNTKKVDARFVATVAVFTAFVTAATALFSAGIPSTNGYFNVGEIMVYTTALLMGPYVGAFAGGVGSMLSDLSLGYPQYAPGTLVIKGTEGFIVGYLATVYLNRISKRSWRLLTTLIGITFAGTVMFAGSLPAGNLASLSGAYTVSLGGVWIIPTLSLSFSLTPLFWTVVALIVFSLIVAAGMLTQVKRGWTVLSVLVGGTEMISGYFIYEAFALRLGVYTAGVEVPFNILQALVGLLIAVPLVSRIRRMNTREVRSVGLPPVGQST